MSPKQSPTKEEEARWFPSTLPLTGCVSPLVMTRTGLLKSGVASPWLRDQAHLSPNETSPDSKRHQLYSGLIPRI